MARRRSRRRTSGPAGHDLQTNSRGRLSLNQLDPQYHGARIDAESARAEPVLRDRQQRRARVAAQSAARSCFGPIRSSPTSSRCRTTGATSIYHALQLSVNRRMSGGLHDRRVLRLVEGRRGRRERTRTATTSRASRSVASYDIPHRLVLSALYEMPFGHGRRFGAIRAAARSTPSLGGWQINGILTIQSGTPLTISASNTCRRSSTRYARELERRRSDAWRAPREDRLQRWFDTSAFSQPAAFTFGNAGATFLCSAPIPCATSISRSSSTSACRDA